MVTQIHRLHLAAVFAIALTCALLDIRAQATDADPPEPAVAMVLGTEIRTRDPEELRYLILRALTDRYAQDQNIEVTPDEIDAYVAGMERLAEKDRKRREGRQEEIERQLASTTRTEAERKTLASELELLRQVQRDLDRPAGGEPEDSDEERQARRTVAAAFIRQWKIDRALYREYGGRLVFQQGGAEPLDAYRMFLEEQQRKGAFQILSNDFETPFWRYYIDEDIHSFYPPGSKDGARVFQKPWWLAE